LGGTQVAEHAAADGDFHFQKLVGVFPGNVVKRAQAGLPFADVQGKQPQLVGGQLVFFAILHRAVG